ncbi:unnamed protein product [Linum trigynum]|uniref:Uncharacterized protein n=1 Tax=Linum trigynum TaxID=586398 RepID=A0AAV2ETQ5_9ROSI
MQFGKRVKFTTFSPEYAPRWPSAITSAAVGTNLGLSVDAQIVDANGSLLDWKSMGEGLFWENRGGDGSGFGIVVSYKIGLLRFQKSTLHLPLLRRNQPSICSPSFPFAAATI